MRPILILAILLAAGTANAKQRGWFCSTVMSHKIVNGEITTVMVGHCERKQNACYDAAILNKSDVTDIDAPGTKRETVGPVCEWQPTAFVYAVHITGISHPMELALPTLALCEKGASHKWINFVVVRQCKETP